jgi:hypothetical protein
LAVQAAGKPETAPLEESWGPQERWKPRWVTDNVASPCSAHHTLSQWPASVVATDADASAPYPTFHETRGTEQAEAAGVVR